MSKIFIGSDPLTLVNQDKTSSVSSVNDYFHYDSANQKLMGLNVTEIPDKQNTSTVGERFLVPGYNSSASYSMLSYESNTANATWPNKLLNHLTSTASAKWGTLTNLTVDRLCPGFLIVSGQFNTSKGTPINKNTYYNFCKINTVEGQTLPNSYPNYTMVCGIGGAYGGSPTVPKGVTCLDYTGNCYITFSSSFSVSSGSYITYYFNIFVPAEFDGTTSAHLILK